MHHSLTIGTKRVIYPGLTHWGRVTHICVGNLIIIGSDNGLSPGWRQAIIWTNAGILLIGTLGTNFSEILIEIQTFSFKKLRLKVSSAKWRPSCLGLNVLTHRGQVGHICVGKLGHHWFIQWLVTYLAPSHYMIQCCNWTIRNERQWNCNRNSYIFIQENPFENVVWKMAAILSRPQCVWSPSKMAAILQTTFSNAYFERKSKKKKRSKN